MARDADQTRKRLLDAATKEFASVGIAGARVDRIAASAGSNKAMIYAYFGNKDGLFDAVFQSSVEQLLDTVRFDAGDLPGYAARLFDRFEDAPEVLRLSTWHQLERGGALAETTAAATAQKLAEIGEAQKAGELAIRYSPVELLSLVRSVASAWASYSHSTIPAAAAVSHERRRETVVEAVTQLIQG
jgi:AcrR family transcriptional regulator